MDKSANSALTAAAAPLLTLYLDEPVCRERFSASRSLTVCLTRTPWYTRLEYSGTETQALKPRNGRKTVGAISLRPHKHLNVSQFYWRL